MATRTQVIIVSDLSGEEASDGQTIQFSYRGVTYTIDVTTQEAAKFDKAMAVYVEHAAKVGGRRRSGRGRTTRDPSQTQAIKAWADREGLDYPHRGRLPQQLIDQYTATR